MISNNTYVSTVTPYKLISALFRMQHIEPSVGVRHVRHLDLSGVFRKAPKPRCPSVLCPIRHDGQVEGRGAGEDEGRRQQKG